MVLLFEAMQALDAFMTPRIVPKVRGKCIELFLEGTYWKSVSKHLFSKHLKEKSMSEQEFYALETKVAKEAALALLARRSYLSPMLRRKLQSKGFSEHAVHYAVDYCQEKGYVDDLSGCKRFIEREERKGKGTKAILFALQKRGIVLSLKVVHEMRQREKLTLKRWWQKHHGRMEALTPNQQVAFLLRRGFSMETILSLCQAR